jgi:photosystem II stability/assembly factor-like uncharacterized protein
MNKKLYLLLVLGILLVSISIDNNIESETYSTSAILRLKRYQSHLRMKKKSIFKKLLWKFIGPVWMSGRITDVEVPHNQINTIYATTASGGVWKTYNQGITWEPIFEDAPSTSIGDMAVSKSDPNIIWVGTGENNSSRYSYSGTGVYKSEDRGKNWLHMGLTDTHHIGRILIHPRNPNIVYVAAMGHLYSYNRERGIFFTQDGGYTWEKILYIDEKTGFIDLVMDPINSKILYTASWQRLRKAWNMWESGPGSAIYRTEDGGKIWKKCSEGLPKSKRIGRIGLAVSNNHSNVVYALIDNHEKKRKAKKNERDPYGFKINNIILGAEVYRSDNRGKNWVKVNRQDISNLYLNYGYYFGQIRVDPQKKNTIYLLGITLMKSTDGGQTFKEIKYQGLHADHHALWINPHNPRHLINGNDGGLNISYDGGQTWSDIDKLPVVQFYSINYDMARPFHVFGSAQDHGCLKGLVTHDPKTDDPRDWEYVIGGEASFIQVDRIKTHVYYSEGLYGELWRVDGKRNRKKNIKPQLSTGRSPLRCNWLTPFIISSHQATTLYYGSQYLFKSNDRGEHWEQISPDLSKNSNTKRGDVPFATITTISESGIKKGLLYVGTDDGNVWITRNNGDHWQLINQQLPKNKWISRIVASKFDLGTVFVSLNGYRDDDFEAYLFKSKNFGKTWVSIANNLPGGPVNVVKEDPHNRHILYVGTDYGVYISLNKGQQWHSLGTNIPTTYVHDLFVHPRDNTLVVATHGRGLYTLDTTPISKFYQLGIDKSSSD